jgi:imidazolonepropionase-like amidohydrolase
MFAEGQAMSQRDSVTLINGLLFDGHSPELREGASVLVRDGRITEIGDRPIKAEGARTLDLQGKLLMPGLIDAHFHAYGVSLDVHQFDQMPLSLLAHHAGKLLEAALMRGYTTVRDAAGADYGLAQAIELGLIRGPRIFFAGRALSQTGGHGDFRVPERVQLCSCGYSNTLSMVVDGDDEVRAAVREELRRGAHQIKIFASGGAFSPNDPVWMPQFCDSEIRTAVDEAATRRSYVMAHAHTAEVARRCVTLGVRSIEHGTFIDAETARFIASADAFVVPTLATFECTRRYGREFGLPARNVAKLQEIADHGLRALEHCLRAGVKVGFGTDLLGTLHEHQSKEFAIRREVATALDILRSATSMNARLLGREGEIGEISPGARADLLVIDGNPLDDISLLERHGESIRLVMKDGVIFNNRL